MAATTATQIAPPPAQVGEYIVEAEIGRGGMGRVYRGHHKSSGALVAIKRFCPTGANAAGHGPLLARFRHEYEALGKLDHPGVPKLLAYVDQVQGADGQPSGPYMVMELAPGRTLAERLKAGPPLTAVQTQQLMLSLLDALQHVHLRGVIHRDLKPSNVMLGPDGRVRLLDFGIAFFDEATNITLMGGAAFTPRYASPEQDRGENVRHQSDIYSAARILEDCLGNVPGRRASAWQGVLARALASDPAQRFASAEQFAQAIAAVSLAPFRNLAWIGVAALAVAAAVAIYAVWSGQSTPPPPTKPPEVVAAPAQPSPAASTVSAMSAASVPTSIDADALAALTQAAPAQPATPPAIRASGALASVVAPGGPKAAQPRAAAAARSSSPAAPGKPTGHGAATADAQPAAAVLTPPPTQPVTEAAPAEVGKADQTPSTLDAKLADCAGRKGQLSNWNCMRKICLSSPGREHPSCMAWNKESAGR